MATIFSLFGGSKPTYATREQQIEALKAAQVYAAPSKDDPHNSYDIGFQLQSRMIIRIRITLLPEFPTAPPIVRIVEPGYAHPWLDKDRRVVGSPELSSWTPSKNLGAVVSSIVQHFAANPPVFVAMPAPGGAPNPYLPPSQQYSAGGRPSMPYGGAGSPYGGAPGYGELPGGMRGPPGTPATTPTLSTPTGTTATPGGSGTPNTQLSNGTVALNGGATQGRGAGSLADSSLSTASIFDSAASPPPADSHAMPRVPSSFPALQTLTIDELRMLADDEAARGAFLGSVDEVKTMDAYVESASEATLEMVKRNSELAARVTTLSSEIAALQEQCKRKEEDLRACASRQETAMESFRPDKLFAHTRTALVAADKKVTSITSSFERHGQDPEGKPINFTEFKAAFIRERARLHTLRVKVEILRGGGI